MNKKYIAFGILAFFTLAFVSAGLITYYSQKQVDMSIDSPISLQGDLVESVSLIAGKGYNLYLIEGNNALDRDVDVKFQFSLLDGEGNELENTAGFYLAYSVDIEYAYKQEYGNSANWEEAQTWLYANLDWFDWILTDSLDKYDASIITNHQGNSTQVGLPYNTVLPEDLSPGKFYAVVYFDVAENVVPGDYTLSIDLMAA